MSQQSIKTDAASTNGLSFDAAVVCKFYISSGFTQQQSLGCYKHSWKLSQHLPTVSSGFMLIIIKLPHRPAVSRLMCDHLQTCWDHFSLLSLAFPLFLSFCVSIFVVTYMAGKRSSFKVSSGFMLVLMETYLLLQRSLICYKHSWKLSRRRLRTISMLRRKWLKKVVISY